MKHPNIVKLENIYTYYSKGDLKSALDACSEKMTYQVPGKSKLAGKFTKNDYVEGFLMKLNELSGGTVQLEVHDILANDLHGTVLATGSVTRHGQKTEYRLVHVWRFENGLPVAWYLYPRDQYQFDSIWM